MLSEKQKKTLLPFGIQYQDLPQGLQERLATQKRKWKATDIPIVKVN